MELKNGSYVGDALLSLTPLGIKQGQCLVMYFSTHNTLQLLIFQDLHSKCYFGSHSSLLTGTQS